MQNSIGNSILPAASKLLVGHGYNFHAGSFAGNHAVYRIFNHQTLLGIGAETFCSGKENLGMRFAILDILCRLYNAKILTYIKFIYHCIDERHGRSRSQSHGASALGKQPCRLMDAGHWLAVGGDQARHFGQNLAGALALVGYVAGVKAVPVGHNIIETDAGCRAALLCDVPVVIKKWNVLHSGPAVFCLEVRTAGDTGITDGGRCPYLSYLCTVYRVFLCEDLCRGTIRWGQHRLITLYILRHADVPSVAVLENKLPVGIHLLCFFGIRQRFDNLQLIADDLVLHKVRL